MKQLTNLVRIAGIEEKEVPKRILRQAPTLSLPSNPDLVEKLEKKNQEYAVRLITTIDNYHPVEIIANKYKFAISSELLKRGIVPIGDTYLLFMHNDGSVHSQAFNHAIKTIEKYCNSGRENATSDVGRVAV